jgi:uncharacterized membrane protein
MIESFIHEWANLLIRWIHFIVGVAWIGASFYFNWLENNLDRQPPQDEGIAGNLWAIHGGGFYRLKKFKTGPQQLPEKLHWFKWEAYTTWLSGITLLIVVYYLNARLFLIDPGVMDIAPANAIIIAVVAVLGSWFAYDGFCRSALRNAPLLLGATIVFYLSLLAYFLSEVFSGRAAYIHVGAAIGTMMVGNVFFVIIPAQKEMVRAMLENRTIDPAVGKNGLLRSTHNNYLTLPVLFLMISNHFPSTYGHSWNWLVLILISLISVAVRHYFNVRKIFASLWLILPGAFLAVLLVMWFTAPEDQGLNTAKIEKIEIYPVIQQRCTGCHSDSPTQPGFVAPPSGVVMDTIDQVNTNADRIYQAAVLTKTMPIGNLTEITQQERDLISRWYFSLDSSGVSE